MTDPTAPVTPPADTAPHETTAYDEILLGFHQRLVAMEDRVAAFEAAHPELVAAAETAVALAEKVIRL